MTEKTEKQNMEYCVPVLFGQKKKRKAGNLSGTSENEQTRGTKSYYVGCMNILLTQPQAESLQTTWNTGKNRGINYNSTN